MFSNFTPAASTGQPMMSKMRLWFAASRIDVRGTPLGAPLREAFYKAPGSILDRIADGACEGETTPVVIEIGHRARALTEPLLARAEKVVAIEVDSNWSTICRARSFFPRLRLGIGSRLKATS